MMIEMIKKIAILGFNRPFSREHRIRNEIEVFRSRYVIDGYGNETVGGIDEFNVVERPNMILRRFIIIIGGIFPRLRIAFEQRYYRKHIEQLQRKNYHFVIPHHIADALVTVESGMPFIFHSHEYLPRQFDGDWLFRFTEIRYRH